MMLKNNRNILYILLIILGIAIIWRDGFSDKGRPEWHHCKESLFEQVVFNNCTLIYEGEQEPA